jgi:hypothetical protein
VKKEAREANQSGALPTSRTHNPPYHNKIPIIEIMVTALHLKTVHLALILLI